MSAREHAAKKNPQVLSYLEAHKAGVKAAEQQSQALSQAADLRQADLDRQMLQQGAASAEEMNAAHRSAMSDMATLDTLSGEYGGGNTVARGRSVLAAQQDETLATVGANARNGLAEIGHASIASNQNALSQIRAIQAPSRAGTMLQIGSQAVSAYNMSQQNAKLDKLASGGTTSPAASTTGDMRPVGLLWKALKQVSVILADARKQAEDILKAAHREAMDKAKMLEKAKATREARKAKAAASQREVVTQPAGPQTAQVGPEVAPWDEPMPMPEGAPQGAPAAQGRSGGHGLSGEGAGVHLSIDEDSGPPW